MNLKPRTLAVACAACFAAVPALADSPPANDSPSFDLLSLLNTKDSPNGLTVRLFDTYEGHVQGYAAVLNPRPAAYSLLSANFRFDISKYVQAGSGGQVALVAHGKNLANTAVWLPDWKDVPGDSIFINRGRTVFLGLEISLRRD